VLRNLQSVTLAGRFVRLEPLYAGVAEALFQHANEPEIWQYMPYGPVDSVERLRAVIVELLGRQARGTDLCFVIVHQEQNAPIGMTRFMEIQPQHSAVEIGGTWLGKAYRRTPVNTESKLLMLTHAFEMLRALRVQIKTDLRNERSQHAIERVGFVREGVLRKHITMPDGYQRSSVYYSVIDDEWPGVKARLQGLLPATSTPRGTA
jgi:RimJ/RimL family protein N-acetyltransferase